MTTNPSTTYTREGEIPSIQTPRIDAAIVRLDGAEKIKTLIEAEYGTIARWARGRSIHKEHVYMMLAGGRTAAKIRDALAEDLGASRAEIDRLLDESATAAKGAA